MPVIKYTRWNNLERHSARFWGEGENEDEPVAVEKKRENNVQAWRIEDWIEVDVFRDHNAEEITALINPLINRDSYHVANKSQVYALHIDRSGLREFA